jgi:oligoendopeptidase F
LNIEVKEFEMLFKDVSRSQTDPVARTPGPDGASPSSAGDLPVWDLADLYASTQDPQLSADLERAERDAKSLQERFRGRLGDLDGAALGAAIAELETLDEIMTRIMSYAGLLHAANMADPEVGRFYQSMQEKITNISSDLIFFTLEINLIDDDDLEKKLADEALARFRPWLRETRAFRPHQMDEALEKMAQDLSVSGSSAWVRLFDETMTALRFDVHGKELALEETLNFLTDPVEENRKAGAEAVGKVLGENARLFAHITNTLAKDKETRDRWRKFSRPVSSRNLSNAVEDEVVDALVDAVRGAYPKLSHRYYRIKAGWFGGDVLDYWNRNAPLPDEDSRIFKWDHAVETVLDAYGQFSPDLASVGKKFFDADWIDAGVRPGKAPGAFAHPTVPSAHPYLLLNFQGKTRDVMTLAHELGHGVHQVLAADQGHFGSQTPLTLAETASVFGEMLTFRSLLAAAE